MTSETIYSQEVEEKIANAMIEAVLLALTAENGQPVLQSKVNRFRSRAVITHRPIFRMQHNSINE